MLIDWAWALRRDRSGWLIWLLSAWRLNPPKSGLAEFIAVQSCGRFDPALVVQPCWFSSTETGPLFPTCHTLIPAWDDQHKWHIDYKNGCQTVRSSLCQLRKHHQSWLAKNIKEPHATLPFATHLSSMLGLRPVNHQKVVCPNKIKKTSLPRPKPIHDLWFLKCNEADLGLKRCRRQQVDRPK